MSFFEANIRPLFIEHCQKCHGEKKQESELRLDSKAGWQKGGGHGAVIVPGDAEGSTLIKAVRRVDKDLQMPPKRPLAAKDIALLEQWVKMGAPDPRVATTTTSSGVDMELAKKHWSFQPVRRVVPPSTEGNTWSQQPLDRFVFSGLKQQALRPNGKADRRTLMRRATFDLTGLPPTLEQMQEFLSDTSPDAFDHLIERLMASTAYGERWGRHWLDVARYADTAGDGADYPVREAIKYRDWVIKAFNADQPYDHFLREQIAGDILAAQGPPAEFAHRVTATGFLAVGKRYGYKPSPDYQYLDFADAIDSVGRSLLGLSLGCARCHDHKFDPVTTAEYYGLYGIFQSTTWAFPGGEEQKRPSQFPALVPPAEAARLDANKTAVLARLDANVARMKQQRSMLDGKGSAGGIDLGFEEQTIGKPLTKPWFAAGPTTVTADAQSAFTHIHPQGKQGVRVGSGKPNDGVRYVFTNGLRATPGKLMHFSIDFRTEAATEKTAAYRFFLGHGVVQSTALDISVTANEIALRNGGKWEVLRKLNPGTWFTLRITIDPARKTYSGIVGTVGDLTAFQDKPLGANWDGIADTFICDGIGHVSGAAPTRDLDNIGLQEAAFGEPGSAPVTATKPSAELIERLKKLDADIAAAISSREDEATKDVYPVAYGVSEGKPINARIQFRGEPDKPGAEAPRRTLSILGGGTLPDPTAGSGRLELANWIASPANPLTARVFVNRVWQWHFGRGLVTTPSDFGLRGDAPSHPDLIDWLTSEFIASNWSMKALHRLIMRSRTYQLASDDDAENLKLDPGNRWLWRYERQALDAESIRDAMLAVSGRLDRSVPGPHPFPEVKKWAYTIHKPFQAVYDSDHRSVYLMIQRNSRHPFLSLFDAADPNLSAQQRMSSTTPTQSLFLMNSPFVREQSEAFARRLLALPGDDVKHVRLAFEMSQGRVPTDSEMADAMAFILASRSKLTRDGTAAWTSLARVLLTSNAFLYLD
ncbi:PSD1 and planctomycete cytochrome C domain-containing protein [Prosthecobacter sp.]|uniref:PSD1 and planctomycete cytochrome C domain-containing protein n=1 Tax=Prosthecobacter sp. TaxID=1965333 RepID=UPI0024879A99|nr:PSD1 and planctomycete cytochrome C domain-containing protein [Prosthecobacter sp.]MDI1314280.1 PSD1 and planctomycete cytochrome C domain-containing protein [Prosthecobacter sp.]